MAVEIVNDGREPVIVVSGVFNADAARRLRTVLPPGSPRDPVSVVVDFSRAREITDTGLAALLDAARDGAVRIRPRGLSHRHHRMLKLLASAGHDLIATE